MFGTNGFYLVKGFAKKWFFCHFGAKFWCKYSNLKKVFVGGGIKYKTKALLINPY